MLAGPDNGLGRCLALFEIHQSADFLIWRLYHIKGKKIRWEQEIVEITADVTEAKLTRPNQLKKGFIVSHEFEGPKFSMQVEASTYLKFRLVQHYNSNSLVMHCKRSWKPHPKKLRQRNIGNKEEMWGKEIFP